MRRSQWIRWALAVLALLAFAVGVAACGSDDESSGGNGGGSEGSGAADAAVDEAQARVEAAMEVPSFEAQGEPFDMSKASGKTVWFIAPAMALPFVAAIADAFEEAAGEAGMEAVIFDGKGQVNEWNKGVQQAVSQGADGIHLQAIDPALVSGPLKQAVADGIVITDSQNGNPDDSVPDGLFGHVGFSFDEIASLQSDYIIWQGEGQAQVVLVTDPKFPALQAHRESLEAEFAEKCPDCGFSVEETDVATMAQQLPQAVQTLVRREPDTDWIISGFDGAASFIEQGLRGGSATEIRLIGADAVTANLEGIRSGSLIQETDVGPPPEWQGWAEIDLQGRALAGEPPSNSTVPVRFFTEENLEGTSGDNVFGDPPFREEYRSLWGLDG